MGRDVYKSTAQDPSKRSKAGRMRLVEHDKGFLMTVSESAPDYPRDDILEQVFLNGDLTRDESLATIRERVIKGAFNKSKIYKGALA